MITVPEPSRVSPRQIAWLSERLSTRDWVVLQTVNQLHLVTGPQLQRLHFATLSTGAARRASRARTLARLVRWRVLTPLPRRIGGVQHGSAATVYALDTAGHRLLRLAANRDGSPARVRRPGSPSDRWTRHILAVSELYVQLVEAERAGDLRLREFRSEPSSWWPDGLGGWLKPDAYVVVSDGFVDHLWWVEVDLGTESVSTVQRKLRTYLDFDRRGGVGPRDTMPRVLLTVVSEHRRATLTRVTDFPPTFELLRLVLAPQAAATLVESLNHRRSRL
jgi:hypothetical protein